MSEQAKKKQKSETDTNEFSDVFSEVIFTSFHFQRDGRSTLTKYYQTNGSDYEMGGQKIKFQSTGWNGNQGVIDVPDKSIVTVVDSKGVRTDIEFGSGASSLIEDFCNLVKLDQKTTGELVSYLKKGDTVDATKTVNSMLDRLTDDLPSKLKCKMSETAKQKLLKLVSYKVKLQSIVSEFNVKFQEAQIKYKKQAALERITNLYKQHQEYLDSITVKADLELLGLNTISVRDQLSLFEHYFKSENKN